MNFFICQEKNLKSQLGSTFLLLEEGEKTTVCMIQVAFIPKFLSSFNTVRGDDNKKGLLPKVVTFF